MLDTPSSGADAKMKRVAKQELALPLKQNLLVSFQDRLKRYKWAMIRKNAIRKKFPLKKNEVGKNLIDN